MKARFVTAILAILVMPTVSSAQNVCAQTQTNSQPTITQTSEQTPTQTSAQIQEINPYLAEKKSYCAPKNIPEILIELSKNNLCSTNISENKIIYSFKPRHIGQIDIFRPDRNISKVIFYDTLPFGVSNRDALLIEKIIYLNRNNIRNVFVYVDIGVNNSVDYASQQIYKKYSIEKDTLLFQREHNGCEYSPMFPFLCAPLEERLRKYLESNKKELEK